MAAQSSSDPPGPPTHSTQASQAGVGIEPPTAAKARLYIFDAESLPMRPALLDPIRHVDAEPRAIRGEALRDVVGKEIFDPQASLVRDAA